MRTKTEILQHFCRGLKEKDWVEIAGHVDLMHARCKLAQGLVGSRTDGDDPDPHDPTEYMFQENDPL